jgi:transposase, IS6 family
LEELMAERMLRVDHTTVWRWVQRYAPELNRRVRPELKRTGTSWRVDETCVRGAGCWMYLYRAVDSCGATLDFFLSENRDAAAAKQFLPQGFGSGESSSPSRHQRGRQSVVLQGREGAEAGADVGWTLPVSNLPLPEQHH